MKVRFTGCAASIVLSVVLTIVLNLLLRSCTG
jgi:tetrahydromethanopterin S-methyltransferase subunit F